jgi:hypothetical protein
VAIIAGAVLGGCDDGADSAPPVDQSEAGVTWAGEIRAFVEGNCTTCHYTGGSTPFSFETYEQVRAAAPAMLDSIASGRMPPWPADPDCRTFDDERRVSPAQLTAFQDWVDADSPAGADADPIVFAPPVFVADLVTRAAAPYTPQLTTQGDDYRCLMLDAEFDVPTWVTGATIEPDTEAVHHVIAYALTPAQVEQALALDAAEDGEGYTCFGGPLPAAGGGGMMFDSSGGQARNVTSWVPGARPLQLPDDTGIPIPQGGRIVVQMHYSAAGGMPRPDHTALQLQTRTTPPGFIERSMPFLIRDLDIPAGMDDVTVSATFRNYSDRPATITSMTGHMHLLGTAIHGRIMRDGAESACGLSIPDWDFDWQLSYRLPTEQRLVVQPGDAFELTCTYDNSQANQPVVDGQQVEPRDVQWGEGSLDEMCLFSATVIEPYVPEPVDAKPCAAAADCYAASDGSLSALLQCETANMQCALCPIANGGACGLTRCAAGLITARQCLFECAVSVNAFGGGFDTCLKSACNDAYAQLVECADPMIQGGACDTMLADACGLPSGIR